MVCHTIMERRKLSSGEYRSGFEGVRNELREDEELDTLLNDALADLKRQKLVKPLSAVGVRGAAKALKQKRTGSSRIDQIGFMARTAAALRNVIRTMTPAEKATGVAFGVMVVCVGGSLVRMAIEKPESPKPPAYLQPEDMRVTDGATGGPDSATPMPEPMTTPGIMPLLPTDKVIPLRPIDVASWSQDS